jgi:hypothetical protein
MNSRSKISERLITPEKVGRLLQEQESVTLEFKQTMYQIYCGKEQGEAFHKGELIKDLLSLANRNVAYVGETSYLIIGAANDQDDNGYREKFNITDRVPSKKELIQLVNVYCEPSLENLESDSVMIEGKQLWVVAIPPTAHLHETIKGVITEKNQDTTSDISELIDKKTERPWYSARTVFIRQGEHVRIATMKERVAIEKAKVNFMNRRRGIKPALLGIILGAMIGSPLAVSNAKLTGFNPTIMFFVGMVLFGFFGGMIGGFVDDIIQISTSFGEFSFGKKVLWVVTLLFISIVLIILYGRTAIGL